MTTDSWNWVLDDGEWRCLFLPFERSDLAYQSNIDNGYKNELFYFLDKLGIIVYSKFYDDVQEIRIKDRNGK